MQSGIHLNLPLAEYLTAVKDQPKPLIIPLCAELEYPGISPLDLYEATRTDSGFLFESMDGSEKLARYSFIGPGPECIITLGKSAILRGKEPFISIAREPSGTDPVEQVRSVLSRFHYVNLKAPRFFGGMVGYIAYTGIAPVSGKPGKKRPSGPDSGTPDARFLFTKDCLVIDHRENRLFIFSSPFLTYDTDPEQEYHACSERIAALADQIRSRERIGYTRNDENGERPVKPLFCSSSSKEEFEQAVDRIRKHILAGDIFQAVLSRKITCPIAGDPFAIYAALRRINPSPYMYFLDFGDEQVIGASPEMLVRVERRVVTTVPIAGTRPRGQDPREDRLFAEELLRDPKERAEHTMLVDLARNDLGRVCRFGSVGVSGFMNVEKFSHVQHIVSTVTGQLQDNLDCYDAFRSCFPAGTVSGAPKIRAMQIIDEEESSSRGLYAGAVGYIGFDKNLDFAIAIRTIVVRDGIAHLQVGAGIVADSVPENEWKETGIKAAAMIRAIEHSGVC